MNDPINPSHYKQGPVETIDIIETAITKAPSNKAAGLHWQVLKYVLRCWNKNGTEDLKKARWYLDRLIGVLEADTTEQPAANAPEISASSFQVGDHVEVTKTGHRYFGRRGFIQSIGDGFARHLIEVRVECHDGSRYTWVAQDGLCKINTPCEPQYRDVTQADIGMEVEVSDYKTGPWGARTLLSFIHPGSKIGEAGYRVETDGCLNWKYARIKIVGEA